MFDTGISQVIIISSHNGYIPRVGSVGVIGDRISRVSEKKIRKSECREWIDGTGKILMPGLVNGHCHGDMTLARGFGDDLTLREQNERFRDSNWFAALINEEDRYYSRQLTYCEALLSGTTFIVENMYWSLGQNSVTAMKETGIRGALAENIRHDFSKPDTFLSDESLSSFIKDCKKFGLLPMVGTISEEDFELERLNKIKKKLSRLPVLQTFHMAETTWRKDRIKTKFNTTPIQFLHENEFLGDRIIGSHVVYANSDEITQLARTNTKVVNTPLCEMKIADGIAPIPEMIRQGVLVFLGTDGAMWNNSNDIFREMKGMSLLHTINSGIRSISKKDILDMATINGAKAFGLEADYGTIEEGKKGDFILVETRVPHMMPLRIGKNENVTSNIIYNATGRDVSDVVIDGKHIVRDGRLLTVDIGKVMNKVQSASEKIATAVNKSSKQK